MGGPLAVHDSGPIWLCFRATISTNQATWFWPYQLAGLYQISAGDVLYPPVTLLLFVPFTFVPALLWWLIPAAAVGWSIYVLRPRPIMWAVATLAIGALHAWPSVLILIKPSLFPFAFFGAHRRSWWLTLRAVVLVCLPFGSLWIDWAHSVLNSQGGRLAYSSLKIPMLAFPMLAYLGRKRAEGE